MPRSWSPKVVRMASSEHDGLVPWHTMTFEFQYRAEGWGVTVVHQDENNNPIPDPLYGQSLQEYELYRRVDFAPLGVFAGL